MADPSATFTAVDLSLLPAPAVLPPLSYEAIYADLLATFLAAVPEFDATVESDPAVKILEVAAMQVLLERQKVQDAAKAVMVAYATGADLDNLAALFGVARELISAAVPLDGIPAVYESDADLRRRLVLAPEGYSVAGPEGAYIFHALTADPRVLDASAASPDPGEVVVTLLSRVGDGTAAGDLIAAVDAYVSSDTRRPLTDHVTVQSAAIVAYAVTAALTVYDGPDSSVVLAAAIAAVDSYIEANHRLGRDVTRSGLFAALHAQGVQNVSLTSPAADVVVTRAQATHCTAVNVTIAGTGE